MRAKVVLSACGLALLILAPTIYFHFAPGSPAPDQSAPEPVAAAPQASTAPVVPHHHWPQAPANGGEGVPAPDAAADLSASNHADYVGTRQAELAQLGMSDDPADLKIILSELNNKDPEIRKAALDATIQFGGKDAIPTLQNEIAWTEDPQEKVDLQNAIKYLQLPSFQESRANLTGAATQQSSEQPAPAN
jgi:hypothetical protein